MSLRDVHLADRETATGESSVTHQTWARRLLAARLPNRYALIVVASGLLLAGTGAANVVLGGRAAPALGLVAALATACALPLLIWASSRAGAAPCTQLGSDAAQLARGGVMLLLCTLVLDTLLTLGVVAFFIWGVPVTQSYSSDVVSFTAVNAQLVLDGQNPYTADAHFAPALRQYPRAPATPLRGDVFGRGDTYPVIEHIFTKGQQYVADPAALPGAFDPRTLHSYPALSFLLYVPLLWLGIQNILVLHVALYAALLAWLVWLAPRGLRRWALLTALTCATIPVVSLLVETEVVCVALILAAWHLRQHRWAGAVLLGLGCAFKQYVWFFAPFFLVDTWRRAGWRTATRQALISGGAFLLPNLPYLLASPAAWWTSLWLPLHDPLFPMGMGLIALPIGGLVAFGPPLLYAVLEVAALIGSVWAYARWHAVFGDAALVLALVPFYVAFRSPTNFFAVAPWLALYAANCFYARRNAAIATRAVANEPPTATRDAGMRLEEQVAG